jgi:hypothetical protein
MTDQTTVVVKEAGNVWKSNTTKWVVIITGVVLGVPLLIGGLYLLYKIIAGKIKNPFKKLPGMGMSMTGIGKGFNIFDNGFGSKLSTLTKSDVSNLISGKLTHKDFARKIKLDKPIEVRDRIGNKKKFKSINNRSVAKQIGRHQVKKPKIKRPKSMIKLSKPKKRKKGAFF